MDNHFSEHGTVKALFAWAGYGLTWGLDRVGIHAWSDAAGAVACIYTTLLIIDWMRKKWKGRR